MNAFDKSINTLKNVYQLYASGLNLEEIERLVKHDAHGLYAYYARDLQPFSKKDFNSPRSILRFIKDIFVSFLLKLPPARRAFYILSLFLFMWGTFNGMTIYTFAGFLLLNLLLALELADKLRTKSDLEFAREIQLSLLPKIPSKIGNVSTVAFTETAMEVGGDYYDWFQLKNGQILFLIGDVSGKGIAAALYMVRLQGFIQMLIKDNEPIPKMLSHLNHLCAAQLRRNYFVTLALALYSPDTRAMSICRAGHNPIIHYSADQNQCHRIEPSGLALGLENNGVFESSLGQSNINLGPGDLVFLYTDGLNETLNAQLEMFGENRVENILSKFHQESPENLKSTILKEVVRFRHNYPIHDDLTFFIIKAESNPPAA